MTHVTLRLADQGVGLVNGAYDGVYALARRHFDSKRGVYKEPFSKVLDKLGFRMRAKSNNPHLRVVSYVFHAEIEPTKKTRIANFIAASLWYGRKPTEVIKVVSESEAIREWKAETGGYSKQKARAKKPNATASNHGVPLEPGNFLAVIAVDEVNGALIVTSMGHFPVDDERVKDMVQTVLGLEQEPLVEASDRTDSSDAAAHNAEVTSRISPIHQY
jgi:hypothetical protein